ncbi:MAG: hypothetical protein JSV21_02955 [Nitrospirota bacterium]|nr:MAG: hypothetical protein JSV21_02955 [Nitrospirota bacterium]
MAAKKRLGEMLVEAGLIDHVQLQSALAHQQKWGMRLGVSLVELQFISERDLASFLEQQLNTQCISIMTKELAPEVINALDVSIAKEFNVFPIELKGSDIVVAASNPLDLDLLDKLSFKTGKRIVPKLALESEIRKAIAFYYDNIREVEPVYEVPQSPVVEQISVSERSIDPTELSSEPQKAITTKSVLDALISVLEQKGVLTRADIFEMIKKRSGK